MSPKAAEPEAEPEEEAPEEPQEGSDSFQFADGSKFKGSWVMKDGVRVRQGHGVFTDGTIEGQTYEGEWADDMMEGRGTFVYASGAKYVGGFQANKYSGFGKFTFPDHSVYEGSFKDNQMHGSGTYTDAQGVEWKGKFYNGTGPGLGHAQVIAK